MGDALADPRAENSTEQAGLKTTTAPHGGSPGGTGLEPPLDDLWEMEEELRHIRRVLRVEKPDEEADRPSFRGEYGRLESGHAESAGWHYSAVRESARRQENRGSLTAALLQTLTWTVLSLGLMAFVCGGVLLGWSMVTGRQDLWTLGMPIALGGQIVLIVGLILQLDHLWHDNRDTAAKLDHVDERLHHLKTTTLLGRKQGSLAGALCCDPAEDVRPRLLLADLKSQLDQLAAKIAQEVQ